MYKRQAEAAATLQQVAQPEDRILSNWSGILEYYLDPRNVVEIPTSIEDLVEQLKEGMKPRAFLVIERQRGTLVWPGRPALLEEWLTLRAEHVATLGERRPDTVLARFGGGYHFQLELYSVDLMALRKPP